MRKAARFGSSGNIKLSAPQAPVTLCLAGLVAIGMLIESLLGVDGAQRLVDTYGVTAGSWDWHSPHDYLTLVTHAFLHGSALHYLGNVVVLLLVGIVVETRLRGWAMLTLWLAGSALSALAHVLLYPEPTSTLVGASGGIAVLMGTALILRRDVRLPLRLGPLSLVLRLWAVLLAWVAVQLYLLIRLTVLSDAAPVVAYWSHLAGFAFGALVFLLVNRLAPRLPRRAPVAQPTFRGD
jgi:membrane associated rhomboid family serine protease